MGLDDRIDKDPFFKVDPGSPHMDADDYRHMGLEMETRPTGEPNARLASEVCARLQQHPRLDPTRITVEVRGNTAILTGIVDDVYARRRAEELASEVEGIESVINHIAVQPQTEEPANPTLTTQMPGADTEGTTQRS